MNMKSSLLAFVSAFSIMVSGTSAMAAFSIDEMHTATATAVNEFVKANPNHADHLTGYKTWKSTDDVKAKIYVSHDGMNMEFNFLCHKHGAAIECHAQ